MTGVPGPESDERGCQQCPAMDPDPTAARTRAVTPTPAGRRGAHSSATAPAPPLSPTAAQLLSSRGPPWATGARPSPRTALRPPPPYGQPPSPYGNPALRTPPVAVRPLHRPRLGRVAHRLGHHERRRVARAAPDPRRAQCGVDGRADHRPTLPRRHHHEPGCDPLRPVRDHLHDGDHRVTAGPDARDDGGARQGRRRRRRCDRSATRARWDASSSSTCCSSSCSRHGCSTWCCPCGTRADRRCTTRSPTPSSSRRRNARRTRCVICRHRTHTIDESSIRSSQRVCAMLVRRPIVAPSRRRADGRRVDRPGVDR